MLTTVHNALALLDAFTLERPEWGVRELARAYALPHATTSRLVSALCNEGFLTRTPAKRYRLNLRLREIAASAARGSDLYDVALPHALHVRRECGFATTVWVLDGLDAVVLERLGEERGEQSRSPRKRWPASTTSGGKAMLAFGSQPPVTSEFRKIRRDGYASEIEESQLGWSSLAVPIFTASGRCAGAVGVEIPQPTWSSATSAKAVALLRDAAQAIGLELP
jgi:IclR family KDG regulon transcriptional repressor